MKGKGSLKKVYLGKEKQMNRQAKLGKKENAGREIT